ncbi:transcriptional regulator [Rhodophyticola sp. CCM32]|uniref:sugar-binding transcriptional regulator n=1 Tax=Rhodophyticola sp. CCM32 TaxID=2916397 RepID=UPI00107F410A|nr:sugar-binding domain-containing protein [Rhodophyticola sp. CCM32]QBX99934.1 transcriptional regulator [Rhodophyticola sp. CCM32]
MSRKIKIDQIDPEEQLLVRLVWACDIEGLTQAAAADRFGITRLRVNKALSEARERGIVRISVDSVYAACAELEWDLARKYGLERAVVVPTPEDKRAIQTLVGNGLGTVLHSVLQDPEIRVFGMSWGNTLNMATRYMEPLNRPDLEIASIMGGLAQGSDVNIYEITTRLADLCNADHSYFTAPLYAGSPESREMFFQQDVIQEMLDKIRSCDAVAMAAGDLRSSLLVKDALPKDVDADALIAKGGVGDLMGYVLDANGQEIDHPINSRIIGMTISDLEKISNVILAAGGLFKVKIIRAILRRGIINTLVTDEDTARALIAK